MVTTTFLISRNMTGKQCLDIKDIVSLSRSCKIGHKRQDHSWWHLNRGATDYTIGWYQNCDLYHINRMVNHPDYDMNLACLKAMVIFHRELTLKLNDFIAALCYDFVSVIQAMCGDEGGWNPAMAHSIHRRRWDLERTELLSTRFLIDHRLIFQNNLTAVLLSHLYWSVGAATSIVAGLFGADFSQWTQTSNDSSVVVELYFSNLCKR